MGVIFDVLAFVIVILFLLAIIAPILFFLNVRGVRSGIFSRFSGVPGFRSGTRWKGTLGVFGYLLIGLIVGSSQSS
jgi:hypothetical protein